MSLRGRLCAEAAVCSALVLITVVLYWPVSGHDFLLYDDHLYVTENHHVLGGLTPEGIRWAFTTTHASNWHPLTWLSHMTDVQLFGLSPRAHHLVNLVLHTLNGLLLFLVLSRATKTLWRSAFVAVLFSCHPLHVESVAWIAERKDLLSTTFFLVAIGFYVRYSRRPSVTRYLAVFTSMALSLMTKPMYVTLPLLLLLMDFWPLERRGVVRLKEKTPLFALSAISAALTVAVQSAGGAVANSESVSLQIRIANSITSCFKYVWMAAWPAGSAVFYPLKPIALLSAPVAASCLALAVVSFLAWRGSRRCPALMVGWLWFLVTLLPVIGIVQAGAQSMADRYTYMSYTGLFIMLSWGAWEWMPRRREAQIFLAVAATAAACTLAVVTRSSIGYWKNSITLFERTLAVTSDNWLAEFNLGVYTAREGHYEDSRRHYARAISIHPTHRGSRTNLGNLLLREGMVTEAVTHLRKAHEIGGGSAKSAFNLANALTREGNLDEALRYYQESLEMDPRKVQARDNYGITLARLGRHREAVDQFKASLAESPDNAVAHHYLGGSLLVLGMGEEAAFHRAEAARIRRR